MKLNLKMSRKLFAKNKKAIAVALFLFILALTGITFSVAAHVSNRNGDTPVQTPVPTIDKKITNDTISPTTPPADTSVQPTPENEDTITSAQNSTSNNSQAPITKKSASSTKTQSNDPPLETFKIINLSVSGQTTCDSGVRRLYLGYAYIHTNSYPGTINWQIEARKNGEVTVVGSGSPVMAMGLGSYEIKNTHSMYTQASTGDVAIRLHVTSPTDTASVWFGPDIMSSGNPCAG